MMRANTIIDFIKWILICLYKALPEGGGQQGHSTQRIVSAAALLDEEQRAKKRHNRIKSKAFLLSFLILTYSAFTIRYRSIPPNENKFPYRISQMDPKKKS